MSTVVNQEGDGREFKPPVSGEKVPVELDREIQQAITMIQYERHVSWESMAHGGEDKDKFVARMRTSLESQELSSDLAERMSQIKAALVGCMSNRHGD